MYECWNSKTSSGKVLYFFANYVYDICFILFSLFFIKLHYYYILLIFVAKEFYISAYKWRVKLYTKELIIVELHSLPLLIFDVYNVIYIHKNFHFLFMSQSPSHSFSFLSNCILVFLFFPCFEKHIFFLQDSPCLAFRLITNIFHLSQLQTPDAHTSQFFLDCVIFLYFFHSLSSSLVSSTWANPM